MIDADDDWFNLSRPGYYAFDLAGMDEETGEQVTGHLVYDIEDAGEEVTVSVDYEFGDEQYQSSITSPGDEVRGQLFLTPAHTRRSSPRAHSCSTTSRWALRTPRSVTVSRPPPTREPRSPRSRRNALRGARVRLRPDDGRRRTLPTELSPRLGRRECPYVATYTEEGDLEVELVKVRVELSRPLEQPTKPTLLRRAEGSDGISLANLDVDLEQTQFGKHAVPVAVIEGKSSLT